jgi:hypothetical protein
VTEVTRIEKPVRKKKNGHDFGCNCASCRGSRNRRKGLQAQRQAAKAAGVQSRRRGDMSNEETYTRTGLAEFFKLEHKYGAMPKFFLDAIKQIDTDRAIGDNRPSLVQVTPKGSTTVYCIVEQEALKEAFKNLGPTGSFAIREFCRHIRSSVDNIERLAQ